MDAAHGIITWKGKFTRQETENLIAEAQQVGMLKELRIINSPGGDGASMYAIQKLVREREVNVRISGYCLSACAQIYLAASNHRMEEPPIFFETYLQFHGSYDPVTKAFVDFFKLGEIETLRRTTAGRLPSELYQRARMVPNSRGGLYVYRVAKDSKNSSVFFCSGAEDKIPEDCEHLAGDASSYGLDG